MSTFWPPAILVSVHSRVKRLKNHTLWGRTYLYSPYKGVPPPPPPGGCVAVKTSSIKQYWERQRDCVFQSVATDCGLRTKQAQWTTAKVAHWQHLVLEIKAYKRLFS